MGLMSSGLEKAMSWRTGRRMLADRRGTAATEFAMLAFPFAFLTFTILESCISFASQELLANATDRIAREMRTGQIKPADITEGKLKEMVCDRIKMLAPPTCLSDVEIDLKMHTTFAEAASESVEITGGNIKIKRYDAIQKKMVSESPKVSPLGEAGTKNTLRVFYKWPVITNFVANHSGSKLTGKKALHYSSVTWQNEPFSN